VRPYFHGVTVGILIGVPQILSTQRIREKKITAIFYFFRLAASLSAFISASWCALDGPDLISTRFVAHS
jgi:hypothetical protein